MNKKSPSLLVRVVFPLLLLATVSLCVAVLLPGMRRLARRQREIQRLREDVRARHERKGQWKREIRSLETDEGIERVARDELHLVKPGERIFVFEPQAPTSTERRP